jgi:hypothetical protein
MQPRRATKNVRSLSSNLPLGTWTQQSTSFTIPANRFGRWLSSDWSAVPVAIPYANLTNPQTLNLYSMVADDPESFADLDGHCQVGGHSDPACPWFIGNDDQHLAAQQPQNQQGTLQPDFKPNNPTNPGQVDLQSGAQISGTVTTSQQVASGQGNVKVALRQTEKKSKFEGDKLFIDVTGVQTVTNAKGTKQTQISVTVTPLSPDQNFRVDGAGTVRFTVTLKGGSSFVGYLDVNVHFSPRGAGGHEDRGFIGSRGDKGAPFDAP